MERKYKAVYNSEDDLLSKYAFKPHGIHSQKKQMFLMFLNVSWTGSPFP